MKFYKVKESADQMKKGNRGDIYIRNELYTLKETSKKKLNTEYMNLVEIPKNGTYWCFGVRYEL